MLTNEQQTAHDYIIDWYKTNKNSVYNPYIVIGGYAGTGKTYLCSQISKSFKNEYKKMNIAFVTFTGKASSVLKSRLIEESYVGLNDYIGTIHSLIYKPNYKYDVKLKKPVFCGWTKVDDLDSQYDLIIIDEASMVSHEIWKDLLSYNIPIIAIGDHGQLPPISDKTFNLMTNLNFELKNVHRQAENSPILSLSKFIRNTGYIPFGLHSKLSQDSFKIRWDDPVCKKIWNNIDFSENNIINLCGFNQTRVNINNMIRTKLKFNNDYPYTNERLICLKNNRESKIMNGQLGTLIWMTPYVKDSYRMTIELDNFAEDYYEGVVHNCCFGKTSYEDIYKKMDKKEKKRFEGNTLDYFDFGYCISVHKSQGSEFDKVVLFEQRTKHWDDEYYAKWLYTAVTRASKKLMVISGFY
jgi:exodeoxyribonuclease V